MSKDQTSIHPFDSTHLAPYVAKKRKITEGDALLEPFMLDDHGYIRFSAEKDEIHIKLQTKESKEKNGASEMDILRLVYTLLKEKKPSSREDAQVFTDVQNALFHHEMGVYEKMCLARQQ